MNTLANFAKALRNADRPAPRGLRVIGPQPPEQRFAVHRNNRALGLITALEDSFPVTRQLLGETCFRAIALDFVHAQPPTSPVLFEYGETLPNYLEGLAALANYPYIADVARLEYHRIEAWHAADATPLPPTAFLQWLADPQRLSALRLGLLPSARLIRSNWAAGSIWQSHQDLIPLQGVSIDQAESVLVLRRDDLVTMHIVSESCAALLEQLLSGECLAVALSAAAHVTPEFDLDEALASLISLRCICTITPPAEAHT